MGVRENTYNNQVFVHSHWGCMQHASTWLLPHKRQLLAVPWTGSQYACNVRVVLVGWNYHNFLCFYSWHSTLCHMCKERTDFNKVTSYPVFTFGKEKLPVSINVNITKTTKQKQDDDVNIVCFKTRSSQTNINWENTTHCFHPNKILRWQAAMKYACISTDMETPPL